MANSKVHKLYLDSRAAVTRENGHADFTWTPTRPIYVENSRAFIDSVHIPNSFGGISATNNNTYVAEFTPDFTVLANQNKLYIRELTSATDTERVVTVQPGNYATTADLAARLQTDLGGSYLVTTLVFPARGIQIENLDNTLIWTIPSRREMQKKTRWNGQAIASHNLDDISDLLGTVYTSLTGGSGGSLGLVPSGENKTTVIGHTKFYRRVSLSPGHRNVDELVVDLQSALNSGSNITAYTVSKNDLTNRITVSNTTSFQIFSGAYLMKNPHDFQGHAAPFYASDDATGLASLSIETGPVTGNQGVNLLRHSTLFINSDLGSHHDSVGPLGQSTIARKVICDVGHGQYIHDFHSQPLDYITVQRQSIGSIRMRLSDWTGDTVQLDQPWSLSIIFVPESEF